MLKNDSFQYDTAFQAALPVRLYTVCDQRTDYSGLSGELRQAHWVLDVSSDDCGCCRVGGAGRPWLTRTRGVAHLYAPGTLYEEDTRGCGEHGSAYLIFDGAGELGLAAFTDNPLGFARICDDGTRIFDLVAQLALNGVRRGNQGILAGLALLFQLADLLTGHLTPEGESGCFRLGEAGPAAASGALAGKVRHYLETHYRVPLRLAEIARALHVSTSGLSHRYFKESGESVFTTLLKIRLQQSIPLLMNRERLKHVARAAGFSDEFYYSRTFKRFYRLSPSEFRERNAGEAIDLDAASSGRPTAFCPDNGERRG